MSVRPVIGIPWTEENAAYFNDIAEGATFQLTMNTGAILTFAFEHKREARRSETDIFRQISLGLVLLLIGETGEEGFPTAARTLIMAAYPVDQELGRMGKLIGFANTEGLGTLAQPTVTVTLTPLPTATPTPIPFVALDVQIVSVVTKAGQVTTQFRLYNGGDSPIPVTPNDLWLGLGYVENPLGPRTPAEALTPFMLKPGQAAGMPLVWPCKGEPFGILSISSWRFSLDF